MQQFSRNENEDCKKLLEPFRQLKLCQSQKVVWNILLRASTETCKQKNSCGVFNKINQTIAL